jgi:hippurate hydrolase
MDALPLEEKSGLPYASTAMQTNTEGELVPVMHACGHDVHITALVGTARRMADLRSAWSGTLMLIGQPAEERVMGARAMMKDDLWARFGQPDYALAFHVSANLEAGKIDLKPGAPYAGADTVEIVIHGVGAHGASPHAGKDPIVLGSQIVLALQTLVSRELPPREPGVVTVGTFHAGTKSNIISDRAVLTLTVRSTNEQTRATLLDGIERIALNLGRAAGLPEERLPRVTVSRESTPPTVNDDALVERLKQVWSERMGADMLVDKRILHMGAEDFPYFTRDPYIPSAYWQVGGTPAVDFERAARGGPPVPSHHSPLFKIAPRPAITRGVEATVTALLDLFADPDPTARQP